MARAMSPNRLIIGTSPISVDDAIDRALVLARDTYGEPDWFEVSNTRGFIKDGRVTHYQVSVEIGYDPVCANPGRNPDHYLNSVIDNRRRNRRVPNTIDRRF